MVDPLGFAGKRVVVTGCASGIGHATASLLVQAGAEVHGIDLHPSDLSLAAFSKVDLGAPVSIDTLGFEGRLDALFNCAGMSPTRPAAEIVRVNFLGTRYLTQKLVDHMSVGSAIVNVSSNGGARWRNRRSDLLAFVDTVSFAEGVSWFDTHRLAIPNGYAFSKEALIVWTLQQSQSLIRRGIRINATSPGAVQTPMLVDIETRVPGEVIDAVAQPIGRRSTPVEQAWPLLMLASDAAAYINGVDLAVDGGWAAGMMLGD
ncbi:coniferyl-alcohol dehydrogenase [Brevundimonas sp.]|uniref:coniferyl-alcohol dehydrogenase n=1 Tax=Brevundimonas sp. TaxID=1871086 RepID=UPI001A1CC510|nr:coniferyl-alcohol dehydrogenase [Brevundimonas sp.]MBJ7483138.1 coniferyl-alcohol dehydrogenase [Brevundimonas sp.]